MAESDDKKLSVEEQVARIKAAKEAAKRDAAAKAAAAQAAAGITAAPSDAPIAATVAAPVASTPPPAPGSVEEKVAQIKAAKAAAAEKMKADAAAKVAADKATIEKAVAAPTIQAAIEASIVPKGPAAVPPETPEAIARAKAAHAKALGATGIDARGTPVNKPAVELLAAAAAKKGSATTAAKKKEPEGPLPPPSQLVPRRRALGFITLGTGAWLFFWAWLAAIGAMFARFMIPNVLYESDPKFNAGRKNDYPESPHVYEQFKQDQAVWIVRLPEEGEDRLIALSTVCTHLGCTPNWLDVEHKFKCPCHGSGYYMNGVNFEGPTPRPLERYRIFVDGTGNIVVDKAKKFRQDLGQWDEKGSFVVMG